MNQTEKKTFDLASLDTAAKAEEGAELELLHPVTGEPLGAFIVLLGTDSSTWRNAVSRNLESRGKRRQNTPEQVFAENTNTMALCTQGWRGVVVDGEDVPFSNENAKKLYRRFPWIREQVDAFMVDRANFLPK